MKPLHIVLVTAVAVAMPVVGCFAEDVSDQTPSVSTEQEVDPARLPGAIIGSSGTIVQVGPGTYPPVGYPPIVCPDTCSRAANGIGCNCPVPHGLGVKSGLVCPYGQQFICFATYCSCY